jgi:hypothetical protein
MNRDPFRITGPALVSFSGGRFRNDRPSYAQMLAAVQSAGPGFDFGRRDEIADCFCGDGT